MPTRAFSIEDGNIGNTSILTAKDNVYSDLDLVFSKKGSGDIFKKQHAAAVKQAVRNVLLRTPGTARRKICLTSCRKICTSAVKAD